MKILVTGSSGTIGSALCTRLIERGHNVLGIDFHPQKWDSRIKTIVCDLRATFPKLDFIPDVLVHLAANPFVRASVENPSLASDNSKMTENVISYWISNKIKHFVFGSSREVYGNQKLEMFSEDNVTGNTESPYAASKLSSELKIRKVSADTGLTHTIVRFSNVYGRYDFTDRFIPKLLYALKRNEPFTIYGKDKTLDFTFIDDCVSGVIIIIEKWSNAPEELNVASGSQHSLEYIVKFAKELLNSTSKIEFGDTLIGEVWNFQSDISRMKQLGWGPQTILEEGLKKAVAYYSSSQQ